MLKHLFALIILFSTIFRVMAQDAPKVAEIPIKYGKILADEFKTKPAGADSSASAVKLFDKGNLRFELNKQTGSFHYVFVKHARILILTKDAYDLANIEITLYKGDRSGEEVLIDFDAASYNNINGVITPHKITKEAKFSERQDKNNTVRKFALANVKEGSIIEYKYEIRSDFLFNLRDWAFQSSIPTVVSDFSITIPEYFNYKKQIKGYVPVSIIDDRMVTETFIDQSFQSMICKSKLQRYQAKNIPALKKEAYITTLEDYISKIEFELSSTQFPNNQYRSYTDTWEKIVSNLHNDENFGALLKSNYGKNLALSIIKQENRPLEKLNLLYSFVKQNIKYNGEDGKYSTHLSLKNIVDKKVGNAADINLLLINILNHAGLESYPILLSTRSNGLHPGYPLISKFNYVIAGVTIDSVKYFLDATNLSNGINMVDFDCLNHKGLALDMKNNTADWIPLELKQQSQNYLIYNLKLSPENVFTGSVFERKSEFNGFSTRQQYTKSQSEEDYLKSYKTNRNGLKIDNFKITNLDSLSSPVTIEYNATVEDMVEEAGNLVYFTPLLYERTKENPFKLEERNFPVDFGFANEEIYRITIELPENLTVDKMPKSELFKLADDSAYFSYLAASDGKRISIVSKISLRKSSYDAATYFELKELFKKIVSKQAEQIVLKKS